MKATHDNIDIKFLQARAERADALGYPKAQWIKFCETLLEEGYQLQLYEARETVSKYIYVLRADSHKRAFKVRFSNHPPNRIKELSNDCDFFVGKTHLGWSNTNSALDAVRAYFQN